MKAKVFLPLVSVALVILVQSISFAVTEQEAQQLVSEIKAEALKTSVMLDCSKYANGSMGKVVTTLGSSYDESKPIHDGSYIAKVRNSTDEDMLLEIRWYFVSRSDSGDHVSGLPSKKTLFVGSGKIATQVIENPFPSDNVGHSPLARRQRMSGDSKLVLVVQLLRDGKILRAWSSQTACQYRAWIVPFRL